MYSALQCPKQGINKMRTYIVGESSLIRELVVNDGATPLAKEINYLVTLTGPMSDVSDFQWPNVRSRKGRGFVDQMLVGGGGTPIGDKSCRITAGITQPGEFPVLKVLGLFQALAQHPTASDGYMEIVNYPAAIKLPLTSLGDTVPAFLPYRTYTDENEQTQVHTWESWGLQRRDFNVKDEEFCYIPTQAGGGWPLVGSILYFLAGSGYTLIMTKDIPASASSEEE
jgi:hypothetical protein